MGGISDLDDFIQYYDLIGKYEEGLEGAVAYSMVPHQYLLLIWYCDVIYGPQIGYVLPIDFHYNHLYVILLQISANM